ncbi:MAG: hypothetical protein GY853_01575 [PVC group bacterium]|nr:hypothetical protein [PVC group bacterium]
MEDTLNDLLKSVNQYNDTDNKITIEELKNELSVGGSTIEQIAIDILERRKRDL